MYCFDSAVVAVDAIPLNSFGPLYAEKTFLYEQCSTSVKLSPELGEITFSAGKPKLTPVKVPTFQGF